MNKTSICGTAIALCALVGCENEATRREPISIVLQPEKGEAVTLQIPRGYVEEPKDPQGVLSHVILRSPAKDYSGSNVFAPESEVRMLIEPVSGAADAAQDRQAAALRRPRGSEDAIVKAAEQPKEGSIAYSFRNGKENAEAYFVKSATGDVFAECWKGVCKAFKTWKKRVHLRFDYQPVVASDVQAVDASIDRMLQSFAAEGDASK